MKIYVLTVRRHPWLLPLVETTIRGLNDAPVQGFSRLLRGLRTPAGRPVSDDETLLALNALCDLGVLDRTGTGYRLNKEQFDATEGLREGIHGTLAIVTESFPGGPPEAQLCVSLPPTLPAVSEHVIREVSCDLRSSLIDVVSTAKHSLIVASPFWDAGTAGEMVSLIDKRLGAGVRVWLLGRFARDLPSGVRSELRRIASGKECSVLSWIEGSGADTETFHFKAASADQGERGYIGSANMTVSSLRSRMELGVIVSGTPAVQLDRILRVVITLASPIEI
jgi:phosphatidylserine/phosphatidylglycerophosphate/cardiolipin synthase-like enzyme